MNKKQFIWNMLGSGIYSLATVIFVMLAKRLVGEGKVLHGVHDGADASDDRLF